MNNNSNTTTGITFTGLLQIVFIVLKLCNVINWSWWWVLAPTWFGFAIAIICFVIALICVVVKDNDRT